MPAQLETSTTTQDDTPYARLSAMGALQTEIEHVLIVDLHDTVTTQELTTRFDDVLEQISRWIDDARLIVFALEQDVTQGSSSDISMETKPIEDAIGKMKPVIDKLMDTFDEKSDVLKTRKIDVTNIQSVWSGLQHFYKSVKQRVTSVSEQKELASLMDQIIVDIEDLCITIFQFQEGRVCHNKSSKSETTDAASDGKEILAEIDDKVSPLFSSVEKVYTRMTSTPPNEASDKLERKHRLVQEKWECLRIDIDELKDDLKEDRWLAVFRQVADQVDTMIDGLDKAVGQCYELIQQVRGWYATHPVTSPQFQPKSILRSTPKSHASNGSISSTFSSTSAATLAQSSVDYAKFKSVEKNFLAKYKYYTPSVQRMLDMLGQGIHSRVSKSKATIERHESMMERWGKLEVQMETVRNRDLPDAEKMLQFDRPISPTWSRISDRSNDRSQITSPFDCRSPGMKNPYSKTFSALPSPANSYFPFDEGRRGRSATPNSGSSHGSRDFYRTMNGGSPSPVYGRAQQRTISPMSYLREATPSLQRTLRPSSSDSSSVSSSPPLPMPRSSTALSHSQVDVRRTRPASSLQVRGTGKSRPELATIDDWKESDEGLSRSRPPLVEDRKNPQPWVKPTKSTQMRRQTQEEQQHQSKTPIARSKTPNPGSHRAKTMVPNRPKSSMGQQPGMAEYEMLPYRERSTTPVRRSGTPSLIPRPKTPSSVSSLLSPSLIPRPRSSLRSPLPNYGGGSNYGFLQVVSNDSDDSHPSNSSYLSVPDSTPPLSPPNLLPMRPTLRKKQSMPVFTTPRTESPFRRTRVPAARTPPPQHSLFEEEEEDYRFRSVFRHDPLYVHDPKDELDREVARIVNNSPIVIKCRRVPRTNGGYYFGSEKMYTCKLMKYESNRRGNTASNKVLVRVGGGWQDLEIFLLEHHHLMTSSTVTVRSFLS